MPRYNTTFDTATLSMIAGEDLSSKTGYFVELSGDGEVEVCNNAGDVPLGVVKNAPKQNEEVALAYRDGDIVNIVAGESIARGALIGTDADGKVTTKTTAGNDVFGIALNPVTAAQATAGAVVNVLIRHRVV